MTAPVLLIDGEHCSEEIASKSLTLRVNALDFTLLNPTNLPQLGDDVELEVIGGEGIASVWIGIVASTTITDNDYPGSTWVTVAATNENEVVPAATQGLDDNDPDNGEYRKLSITRTLHEGVEEVRGTLETLVYFNPTDIGTNLYLTSKTHGFIDTLFAVTDLTIVWLNDDEPLYRLRFGEPVITLPDAISEVPIPAAATWGALGLGNGTVFPASPATNDLFYRTDTGMWMFYDGTRWLSQQVFFYQTGVASTISATSSNERVGSVPAFIAGMSDIWLMSHRVAFIVNAGTALSGSHKWVGTVKSFESDLTSTTVATSTIDSGSNSIFRVVDTTIGALQNTAGTVFAFLTTWTKTGTPGTLDHQETISYRYVDT